MQGPAVEAAWGGTLKNVTYRYGGVFLNGT
jgi:hypothetical protein